MLWQKLSTLQVLELYNLIYSYKGHKYICVNKYKNFLVVTVMLFFQIDELVRGYAFKDTNMHRSKKNNNWKVQGHFISLTFDLSRHTHKMYPHYVGLLCSVSYLTFHLDIDLLFKFRF